MKTMEVCLMNTEQCNLNCSYCYRDRSFNRKMTLEVAYKQIDSIIASAENTTLIRFLFMAGEPFLAFDVIKGCVQYVRGKYSTRGNISFKAVSNGTLVHGEIQKWLLENRDLFEIVISLDGNETTQNSHRGVSFDKIDLDFFKNNYRGLNISSVLMPDNLNTFAEDVKYMESMGFFVKCSIADGVDWNKREYESIFADQLNQLIDYYLLNPHIYPMKMLNVGLHLLYSEQPLRRCMPGVTGVAITPDGKRYACHRCTPFYNNGNWSIPEDDISLRDVRYMSEKCEQCIVKNICSPCPASVAAIRRDKVASAQRCIMNKILFMANALLQSKMILQCPEHIFLRNRSIEQLKNILKAAKLILKELDYTHPY